MLSNGLKRGLVHGGHSGAVVLAGVAGDVDFQRHRADRGTEIVEAHLADIEPIRQVSGISQGG